MTKLFLGGGLIISLLLTISVPDSVYATGTSSQASTTSTIVRLEVFTSQLDQVSTPLNTLRSWLGIRSRIYLHPEPGTGLVVRATGYAPSPYQTDATPCITAAGTRVRRGTVATNFLPLGTLLQVGDEVFIVEDRMNPRHHKAIDIFFASTSEAIEFGNQQLEIIVIGYGQPGQELPRNQKEQEDREASKNGQEDKPDKDYKPPLTTRVRGQLIRLRRVASRMIGARTTYDVNQYDVDCFKSTD